MTHGLPGTRGRRRIHLMRHGEVDYHFGGAGVVDVDVVELTEKGRRQAALLGGPDRHYVRFRGAYRPYPHQTDP